MRATTETDAHEIIINVSQRNRQGGWRNMEFVCSSECRMPRRTDSGNMIGSKQDEGTPQ